LYRGRRKNEMAGAIFPVLPVHVPKLFDRDRDVFVKFTKFSNLARATYIVYLIYHTKGAKLSLKTFINSNVANPFYYAYKWRKK
jgi:hypothetical protein